MKSFIKSLIPPIMLDIFNKIKPNKYGWHGNYTLWEEAKASATGYDSEEILKKVRVALLKVKNGEAVYERDSVIFDEVHYSWPLLAGLMYATAISGGGLKVLDFGGSLGTTYFQNKKFLDEFDNLSWSVVEQKHFVDVGRSEFQDERLKFFYDVKSCIEQEKPNVLLLSSVLQYIEEPYELLDDILQYEFKYLIVDRTPFNIHLFDIIKLQKVPTSIYNASYPCWIFFKRKFISFIQSKKYSIQVEFNSTDRENHNFFLKGFIFKRDKC